MSVWQTLATTHPSLTSSEGTLISVSVHVEPRYLESLLEALARVNFPVNPRIYHHGSIEYSYADGRIETEPITLVEFPAYEGRLPEVRRALAAYDFPADSVHVAAMLDEIHSEAFVEPAPHGAAYVSRIIRKQAGGLTALAH